MRLEIFTPGHGAFMDSLIMYGLVSALRFSDVECYVSGTSGVFKIEVEESVRKVAELVADDIKNNCERIVVQLIDHLRVVQKGSQRRLESYLSSHSNSEIVAKSLEKSYTTPGHAQNEGRYHKGQHVWLPFYPHIGKYFTGEYEYPPSNYGVCPTCIALAALGFHRAAIPIQYKNASHVILLSFDGEVSRKTLAEMLTFIKGDEFNQRIEKLRLAAEDLPLNIFTYVLLANLTSSILRSLYESKALWTALSTTFDVVKGQVVQIRGYEEISIDKYLSSLIYLMRMDEKYDIDSLKKLGDITEKLIRKKESATIETLYRFINTRSYSDLYMATRQIVKALREGFGKIFCEELACLTQLA
ncbi:MAG: hypothetical protein QXK89_07250 [Candidatus Bathyarchaeia archaeon]